MAYSYTAPLADMRFVIERVLEAPASWRACPSFAELDAETGAAVLAEAARFASEVLQPTNAPGDLEGCTLDAQGNVRTPAGYREAYRAFVEGGWPALPCDPAWGGQGLPLVLDAAMREMLSACNHGWNMYPDLLHGAYETIKAHGSEELKARYLGKVATGEWLAAMALTEPGAGSDLGALRTKAEPRADGSVAVSGHKIFISGADHDLSDNVVHLVLARLQAPGEEAPPGTRGLSLVLVPKWLPSSQGQGTRNAWVVEGIEQKMGIHGSATCAVRYEGATGWLVGEPHRGLAAMFLMMNSARLHVGLQGLGHQEMATQNALRYAFEREQFRGPIAGLPAMRHLLLRAQALTEGQRAIAYRAALAIDEAHHHADADRRALAASLAALLTPVVKAFCTHHGFHGAAAVQQVFGGYGYVHEFGIEQTVRDARIAMVYEGTNEIQAIDLLQRKVLADGGRALAVLLEECEAEAARTAAADPALAEFAAALREQVDSAGQTTAAITEAAKADAQAPLRAADDYLVGVAHLLLAWAWAASARSAKAMAASPFSEGKLQRMRYGLVHILPQAAVHWQRARACGLALPAVQLP
ncbi:MAG: acyl-CoA dehydrogenase [Burkholderiales bacterium]|nr:acyl-CoA dehydrogenase [Burkholderiales bacterium]